MASAPQLTVVVAVALRDGPSMGFVPTQYKATQLVVALAVWATQRSDPDFTEATPTLFLPVATSLAIGQ
jgi:hypothetical protein